MPASVIITDEKDRPVGGPTNPLQTQALSAIAALSSVAVSFAATTEQTIIAGASGQTNRVHRVRLYAKGAADITVRGSLAGAVLEVVSFPAAGAFVLDYSDRPYWVTASGGALTFQSSAAVQITGRVEYVQG